MSDNTTFILILGIVTFWICLCTGTPDLLDAITKRVGGYNTEEMQGDL